MCWAFFCKLISFGTLATALGLGQQMGMLDENGNFPIIGKIFPRMPSGPVDLHGE